MPLRNVIIYAFGINPLYVAGVPAWGDSERYDIAVRATEQSTVTEQNRALVRSVLVERFRLKSHTERRTMPLYRAVLARSDRRLGEKLRPVTNAVECPNAGNGPAAAADTCRIVATPGGFSGKAITVAEMLRIIGALGAQFGGVDSAALEDGTGLTGRFDVSFEFSPQQALAARSSSDAGAADPAGSTAAFRTALEDQLGLRIQQTEGLVDFLVIDEAVKPTAD